MRRILFAAAVAACFALPALAAGDDDSSGEPAGCGDDVALMAPAGGSGCQDEGNDPAGDVEPDEDLPPDASEDPSSDEADGDALGADEPKARRRPFEQPRLKAAFLHRAWRIIGEASGYEAGILDFTAERFRHLPRRWASQDNSILGEDARVLVGSKTRVYGADRRRLAGAAIAIALDEAIDVTLTAKILPPAKWHKDEDGRPVPTLRAKRVTILE